MAFRTAARIGMAEALGKANPVLLEPIFSVEVTAPSEALVAGDRDRFGAARTDPRL